MIDVHKNVIKYQIEHGLRYVNKYENNAAYMYFQMARISLIDRLETRLTKNNGSTLF